MQQLKLAQKALLCSESYHLQTCQFNFPPPPLSRREGEKNLLEKFLIRSLFLGGARSRPSANGIELVRNGFRLGSEAVSLFEILDGGILVLEAHVGEAAAVKRLCAVGGSNACDGECGGGAAGAVGPVFELHVHQGCVVVEREADGVEGGLGGCGLVVEVRVFVEVAEALFVLVQAKLEVAGLEGLVAKVFAGGGNLENLLGWQRLLVRREVVGEVFVGVAGGIGLLDVGAECFVAGELAAVDDERLLFWRVAGRGAQVLDLAYHTLAVEDFAKYDVLVVKVRGGYCGDEELRAVCI